MAENEATTKTAAVQEEFKKIQDEYYRSLLIEMKDDCDTYKKATECHEYAKMMSSYFKKYREGLDAYIENCHQRKAGQSCHNAAITLLKGVNDSDGSVVIERNVEQSIDMFKLACIGNYPKSCSALAKLLQYGKVVQKDYKKAFEYLTIGCDNNNTESCFALANAHIQGMGTDKDPAKAAGLLEQGCLNGFAKCCHNLAVLYYQGSGVKKDLSKFKEYNKKAQLFRGQVSPVTMENNPLKEGNLPP